MRIFLDINHPSHFHFFRNFILSAREKGHEFRITSAEKDCMPALFDAYNISFINKGKRAPSIIGKTFKFFREVWFLYKTARKFKPDLFISFASPYASLVGFLLNKPVITFDDTEDDPILHRIYPRFSDWIITPECYEKDFGSKHLRFKGYKETGYMKNISDKGMGEQLESIDKPIVLFRFVKHSATHEYKQKGLSTDDKVRFIEKIRPYARIFISSEQPLPKELKRYEIEYAPEKMHSFLKHITLFFGESATMAAESAVMGVQSVLIEDKGRGYTRDIEKKYGLIKHFPENQVDKALKFALDYLKEYPEKAVNQSVHEEIISKSTDVTAFLDWLTDEYPDSLKELSKNPGIPDRF